MRTYSFTRRSTVTMFGLVAVAALALGACSNEDSSGSTTSTTASGGGSTTTTAGSGNAPVIKTFNLANSITCTTGTPVSVKASWTTTGANEVKLEIDGAFDLSTQPANGETTFEVNCTAATHRIVLEALSSSGGQSAVAHQLTTEPGAGGSGPTITNFEVETTVTCSEGGSFSAPAQWSTTNAGAIGFEIDGQSPGAQAGYPTSGSGNVGPIPCDGKPHQVSMFAYGANQTSTSVSHTVTGTPS